MGKSLDIKVMLDSGAFSVWRRGATIDLREYIDYISRNHEHIHKAVNLDVIPGRPGARPTAHAVEDAAKQGWKNYVAMRKAGIDAMPVYHVGERLYWLEKMVGAGAEWVGFGGLVSHSSARRHAWLQRTFAHLAELRSPMVKVHGFGVTAVSLQLLYPWFSLDSTSWVRVAGNGMIFTPKAKGGGEPDFSRAPVIVPVADAAMDRAAGRGRKAEEVSSPVASGQHYDSLGPSEQHWIRSWLKSIGISLDDVRRYYDHRAAVNARFFLAVAAFSSKWSSARSSSSSLFLGSSQPTARDWKALTHYFTTVLGFGYNHGLNLAGVKHRLISYEAITQNKSFSIERFVRTGIGVEGRKPSGSIPRRRLKA